MIRSHEPPAGVPRGAAVIAAGLAGFGCMAAELTAVRVLAPHFGDSAYVWTNVIGVILAALAGGAAIGGRLAAREPVTRQAGHCLLLAGLLVAAAPWLAPWVGAWLLPPGLPLDAAMPVLVRSSFVATVILFAPAMLALGAVSPLLVTSVVRAGREVGRAAGAISAVGTLGSLLGTFVATHWLVPSFGCRLAMAVAGALLAAASVPLLVGRARTAAAAAVVLLAASGMLARGPLRAPGDGQELLAERESRVQFLQVLRTRDTAGERTALVINEGLDSFHSLAVAGSAFTGGAYYDYHAVAPLLAGDGKRPDGLTALSIGDAAGTLRAVYAGVHPGARVDAVDIDAATMELGDAHFPGPKADGRRFVIDGRVFLASSSEHWHVIHVDAYAHQVYVPAHLASYEFFVAARERLHDGGVLACNVGALQADDHVLRAIGATMAEVFGDAWTLLVPSSRNALVVARRGRPLDPAALRDFTPGTESLTAADRLHWREVVDLAANPAAWRHLARGGEILRDDRPVLDRLLAASYIDVVDPGLAIPCNGSVAVAGAELTAWAAYERRDFPAVLAAVASSASASALLRELAGHARWSLRELRSAAAEYDAALVLAPDEQKRRQIHEQRTNLTRELAPILRAEQAAQRAGWLRFLAVGCCAALAWLVARAASGSRTA